MFPRQFRYPYSKIVIRREYDGDGEAVVDKLLERFSQ